MAKLRRKFSPATRLRIAQRALFLCEYCKSPEDFSPDSFDIEHIVSLVAGGSNEDDNLALARGGCNAFKYTHSSWKDPLTGNLSALYHPRQDIWNEHFTWSEEFSLLTGLTPKGRATIDLLKMNRPKLINLRKAILAYGNHPAK